MKIAMIGLGKMGANMVRRWVRGGANVVAYDANPDAGKALNEVEHLQIVADLPQLIAQLPSPRIVWLMLPAGEITQQTVDQICPLLSPGDIIVDGANAFYKDSMQRAEVLREQRIHFVDAGVSGGVWGLENGYAIMFGGSKAGIAPVLPFIKILAPTPETGWMHCGPSGAGHFVKMIHNGIEYGMMQSFAEGLALLQGREDFAIDLAGVTEMWRHGSVVRSWLLDLTAEFLKNDQQLEGIKPHVADSGEGRWTALEGIEQGIPTPVMSLALMMRFASQGSSDYQAKLLAMMRNSFGGHAVGKDK